MTNKGTSKDYSNWAALLKELSRYECVEGWDLGFGSFSLRRFLDERRSFRRNLITGLLIAGRSEQFVEKINFKIFKITRS